MTKDQLRAASVPFLVKFHGKMPPIMVTRFSENDPRGLGGGSSPPLPIYDLENGGFLLASGLLEHYEVVTPHCWAGLPAQPTEHTK